MMWFATWNGLNRYDGYEFVNFKSRAGDGIDMPSDRIRDIALAEDGNLRCKVDDRVLGFCTKTYKFYQISASEEKKMLAIFERKRNEGIVFNKSGEINTYKDIYGTEWIINHDGRMKYKNPSSGQLIDYPAEWNGAQHIHFCLTDKEGNAWFTSSYGVFKLSFQRKAYQ